MPCLPCIERQTRAQVDACVIWLHGLGASGHDFEPIVPQLNLPEGAGIRFIFPNAPSIPITINSGYVMPAWYDILALDLERQINEKQFNASVAALSDLIGREIERSIDSRRILIAGFSQGGAIAYHCALSYPKPLAGLMALSTYFSTHETIKPSPANKDLDIQLYHGTRDPMVPEEMGHQARQILTSLGYKPKYKCYNMEHEVCPQQIGDMGEWITERLSLS